MTAAPPITLSAITLATGFAAAVDQGLVTIALAVVSAVVAITTIVFAFKTATLNKRLDDAKKQMDAQEGKIEDVIKTSDGMKDALVKATATASRAEGVIAGVAQAETKAAVVTAATADGKAAGVAQEKEAEKNRQMTPGSV